MKIKKGILNLGLLLVVFLIVAYFLCLWMENKRLIIILDKLIFGTTATFVGLTIAITGIFLTSVNTIYLNLFKVLKSDDKVFSDSDILEIKNGLSEVVGELKDNTVFIVIAYAIIIMTYFLREIDVPLIIWFVDHHLFSERLVLNSFMLSICMLIYYGIWDSIQVIFRIVKFFEFVKE